MNFMQLVKRLEACLDNSDLVLARTFIEENIDLLIEHKNHLRRNVRELVEVLYHMPEIVGEPLTQKELNIIHSWNAYATNFDLRGLKLSVKNNHELLLRDNINEYLNTDAKVLLEGMSVI